MRQGITTIALDDAVFDVNYAVLRTVARAVACTASTLTTSINTASTSTASPPTRQWGRSSPSRHFRLGSREQVFFNHRGAILAENGAEFSNLSRQRDGCEQPSHLNPTSRNKCGLEEGVPSQSDADIGEQSAIYGLSANAVDIVGNRIFGNDNAHFWNQNGKTYGQDIADGKVSPKATQGARFEYNVIHDVFGFSWYANLHAPMKIWMPMATSGLEESVHVPHYDEEDNR